MAVRAPLWLSDVLKWRWLPTVALVLASLLYVLFALAFVPTDIRFSAASPSASALPGADLNQLAPGVVDEAPAAADATVPADESAPRRRRRTRRRAEPAQAPAAEVAPAP